MGFEVKRRAGAYWVIGDEVVVAGPFTNLEWAEERKEKFKRKAMTKERKCLTCTKPFLSEGPHNRMCGPCRNSSSSAISDYQLKV